MQIGSSQSIGLRLMLAIQDEGLTPAGFARKAGISRSRVSQWLKGLNLTVEALSLIGEHLPVSLNWLVYGEGQQEAPSTVASSEFERQLIRTLRHIEVDAGAVHEIVLAMQRYREKLPSLSVSSGGYDLLCRGDIGWIRANRQGVILDTNPAIQRLIGASHARQLIGRSTFEFVCPEYHHKSRRSLDLVASQGYGEYNFVRLLDVCGETKLPVVTKACLREHQGYMVYEIIIKSVGEPDYA
ncbi:Uncharacterised protein [BD1-7 clade bacterium]|nr:Uncharacterised protein [BD1-7 clade bacterium]